MKNEQLMAVSKKSETADRILRMVADRRRNTVYTAFSGLRADLKKRDGKPVHRKEFDQTFNDLQSIGAGKIDKSKRGTFLGFTWSIPIRQIGTLLKNKDQVGKAIDAAVVAKTNLEVAQANQEATKSDLAKKVTLVILRKNREPETVQVSEDRIRSLAATQ